MNLKYIKLVNGKIIACQDCLLRKNKLMFNYCKRCNIWSCHQKYWAITHGCAWHSRLLQGWTSRSWRSKFLLIERIPTCGVTKWNSSKQNISEHWDMIFQGTSPSDAYIANNGQMPPEMINQENIAKKPQLQWWATILVGVISIAYWYPMEDICYTQI